MEDCVFCKIVKGELPSTIEYEDDEIVAFRNINPIAPVHILIIPKKHILNLSAIGEEDIELLGSMLVVSNKLAKKLDIINAFRIGVANGEYAGQTVFHMHFHLTGGWKTKYNRDEDKA
ncbi:MAG: histidine triad nucleotide-binding protein [bacterium]|nr:MAG: histidine triad nucleotide-binding protein [bacterium]